MRDWRVALIGGCIAGGFIALGGCGNPAVHKEAASTTAMPIPRGPSCGEVGMATVNRSLGTMVSGPTVRTTGSTSTCDYSSGNFRAYVVVSVTTDATPTSFAASAQRLGAFGATTTSVAGIGDFALASAVGTGPDATFTVAALHGGLSVTVTAPVALAKVESLVIQLLATL